MIKKVQKLNNLMLFICILICCDVRSAANNIKARPNYKKEIMTMVDNDFT